MSSVLKGYLDEVMHITDQLMSGQAGDLPNEHREFLKIVQSSGERLQGYDLQKMNLLGLSAYSHDMRQPLMGLVGYSSLLASGRFTNQDLLTDAQKGLFALLHDRCRYVHWRLDNLLMFAGQVVRPLVYKAQDSGLLNLRGYLTDQAESYVVSRHLVQTTIDENIPDVHANDAHTKMMLRGLFASALEVATAAQVELFAYADERATRISLVVYGQAEQLPALLKLLKVRELRGQDAYKTLSMHVTVSTIKLMQLLELGLYTAAKMALQQGGRFKVDQDGNDLLLVISMPNIRDYAHDV